MRERPLRLASRRPGRSRSEAPKPDSTVGAVLSLDVHGAAPRGSRTDDERVRADRVGALGLKPVDALLAKLSVATPSAPVVAP